MSARPKTVFTEDEYLALEHVSARKHELVNGEILAMAGGTPEHGLLISNVNAALRSLLRGAGCVVFTSDVRIHVPATALYTYPDLSVVCGKVERHVKDENSIVNPRLLVEVLSDSTEGYDQGEKLVHYRSIPTLDTYLLVSHREPLVVLHEKREGRSWLSTEYRGEAAVLPLGHFGVSIPLAEIYADLALVRAR